MKQKVKAILNNDVFVLLLSAVIIHTAFVAVVMSVMQVPPESLLDSNLQEVLFIFEQ